MKAHELRIGNYIKGKGINVCWCISGIQDDLIHADGQWRLLNVFDPIPLTEEWLNKFGFQKQNMRGLTYSKDGDICIDLSFKVNGWHLETDGLCGYNSIKSVHQLQNLYFALTGEELTIKND